MGRKRVKRVAVGVTSCAAESKVQENVHKGLEKLADKHVTEHEHTEQKPALTPEDDDEILEDKKYS